MHVLIIPHLEHYKWWKLCRQNLPGGGARWRGMAKLSPLLPVGNLAVSLRSLSGYKYMTQMATSCPVSLLCFQRDSWIGAQTFGFGILPATCCSCWGFQLGVCHPLPPCSLSKSWHYPWDFQDFIVARKCDILLLRMTLKWNRVNIWQAQ